MTKPTKTLDERIADYISQIGCDGASWECKLCNELIADRQRLLDENTKYYKALWKAYEEMPNGVDPWDTICAAIDMVDK